MQCTHIYVICICICHDLALDFTIKLQLIMLYKVFSKIVLLMKINIRVEKDGRVRRSKENYILEFMTSVLIDNLSPSCHLGFCTISTILLFKKYRVPRNYLIFLSFLDFIYKYQHLRVIQFYHLDNHSINRVTILCSRYVP